MVVYLWEWCLEWIICPVLVWREIYILGGNMYKGEAMTVLDSLGCGHWFCWR